MWISAEPSARFEQKDGLRAEVEVDEMLCRMHHVRAEVGANYAVPCGAARTKGGKLRARLLGTYVGCLHAPVSAQCRAIHSPLARPGHPELRAPRLAFRMSASVRATWRLRERATLLTITAKDSSPWQHSRQACKAAKGRHTMQQKGALAGSPAKSKACLSVLTPMLPQLAKSSPVLFVELVLNVPRHLGFYVELVERTGRHLAGRAGISTHTPQVEAAMKCTQADAQRCCTKHRSSDPACGGERNSAQRTSIAYSAISSDMSMVLMFACQHRSSSSQRKVANTFCCVQRCASAARAGSKRGAGRLHLDRRHGCSLRC